MSCCGCFESATGLEPETGGTTIDIDTSNILYTYTSNSSNSNYYYTSNTSNNLFNYTSNTSNKLFNEFSSNSSSFIGFSNQILSYINKDEDSNIYFNNSNNTIINSNSDLLVYHTSNFLIPLDQSEYWNVESKITSNIIETNLIKFDFSLLQSALTGISSLISTIQAEISALEASDVAQLAALVTIEEQIQSINAILANLDTSLNTLYPLELQEKNLFLNYNQNQFNLDGSNLNILSIYSSNSPSNPTHTNGNVNIINSQFAYIKWIQNGNITFPSNTTIDFLVVGAGGDGGAGFFGGGGGAGEVIYKSNHLISAGTYQIQVGNSTNRISKLYQGGTTIVTANGGGDGGFFDIITNSIYNYYIFESTTVVVNYTNNVTLTAGTNKIIFNEGYIEINGVKDKSYPIIKRNIGGTNLTLNPHYWYKFISTSFLVNDGSIGSSANLTNINGITPDTLNFIKTNASAPFNGTNQYFSITYNNNLRTIQTTTGLSISFWVYPKPKTPQNYYVFSIDDGFDTGLRFSNFFEDISIQFEVSIGYETFIRTNPSINYPNNKWYFITITFATNFDVKLFINNELVASDANFQLPNVNLTRFIIGGGIYPFYFQGNLDDFRIYHTTLTTNEITQLYKGSVIANKQPTSGGSGGGGCGGVNYNTQTGANAGTPWNITYSKLNNGSTGVIDAGGNGGSALISGEGYTELITDNEIVVGKGGLGNGEINYYPEPKNNYGDGGDGYGGKGFQGVIIIKVPYIAIEHTFTGFTYWSNVKNVNTSNPVILGTNNTIGLSYDSLCNINLTNGFINSNITTTQLIPSLNANEIKLKNSPLFEFSPANTPTFVNGTKVDINATNYYIQFTQNGLLSIPANMTCDILVVGAGGRGLNLSGGFNGGGGAGEVIYYPNLNLVNGNYDIEIGVDSSTPANRISKIKLGITDIISAKGGGDGGGYVIGPDIDRRFPSKGFSTRSAVTSTTFNGKSCFTRTHTLDTSGITYGSGVYEIFFSTRYDTTSLNDADNLFDLGSTPQSAWFLNNNYTATSGVLTTQGNNYWLVETAYKGDWVCIKLPFTIALTSYKIQARSGIQLARTPKNFRIYASNDGTTWVTLQTITNASYVSNVYTNTALSANTTQYQYYAMVVNVLLGGNTSSVNLNFVEWEIYGKQLIPFITAPTSGGSGGGGSGGNGVGNGAIAGTPFNVTYSKLTNGYNGTILNGGNGGSALISGRFETTITGSSLFVGAGGIGGTLSSTPTLKINYGDGGDGNGGLGHQGIIILKFSVVYLTKFLEYTNWNKLFNINLDNGLTVNTNNNNLISLNYDSTLTLNGSQLSVTGNSASKWLPSGNNIYNINTGKVGIGTSTPEQLLHLHRNLNDENVLIKFTRSNLTGLDEGARLGLTGDNFHLYVGENKDIRISAGGERLRLKANGNVAVGEVVEAYHTLTLNRIGIDSNNFIHINNARTGVGTFDGVRIGLNSNMNNTEFLIDFNHNQPIKIKNKNNKGITIGADGYVGINNETPYYNLSVVGDTLLEGNFNVVKSLNDYVIGNFVNDNAGISASCEYRFYNNVDFVYMRLHSGNHTFYPNVFQIHNTIPNGPISIGNNSGGFIYLTGDGNVGINSTSPAEKFEVVGNVRLRNNLIVNGTSYFDTPIWIYNEVMPTNGHLTLHAGANDDYAGFINFINGSSQIRASLGAKSMSFNDYLSFTFNDWANCLGLHSTGNLINDGNVSIKSGVINLDYPLYVGAGRDSNVTYLKAIYHGFHPTSGLPYQSPVYTGTSINFSRISIFAVDSILTQKWFAAVSDLRIKNEIKPLENALDIINKFNVVNYKYKDFINKGNKNNYGFIAQEVKEVIPDIVSEVKEFIPNIYRKCNLNKNTIYIDDVDLIIGDKIKIIDFKDNENICNVIERNNVLIKIDKEIDGKECFIYGKEVNDYMALSKEHIFAINVKATQELYKLIQNQQEQINKLNEILSNK